MSAQGAGAKAIKEHIASSIPDDEDEPLSVGEKVLYVAIIVAVLVGMFMAYRWYDGFRKGTVDNEVKLERVYNGFEFNQIDGLWVTQWKGGSLVYELAHRFHPAELEDVPLRVGKGITFNEMRGDPPMVYITFDANGPQESFPYLAYINGELTHVMFNFLGSNVTVGCTSINEDVCPQEELVVRCDSEDDKNKSIILMEYAPGPEVIAEKNCVIIRGEGEDLIRASERFLYTNIFRIMQK